MTDREELKYLLQILVLLGIPCERMNPVKDAFTMLQIKFDGILCDRVVEQRAADPGALKIDEAFRIITAMTHEERSALRDRILALR